MRRFIIYMAFAAMGHHTMWGQSMHNIFRNMPDSVMPLLTKNDRLDFIDYLDSGMKAEVTNRLGGKSEMTAISNDYAHIRMTNNSEIALKLLPYANDSIICMIHTFSSTASDSKFRFFTKEWKELTSDKFITMPSANDFFTPADSLTSTERNNLMNKMDATLIKAEVQSESAQLNLTLTTPLLMSKEDREAIKPYIRASLTKTWNGERFQ